MRKVVIFEELDVEAQLLGMKLPRNELLDILDRSAGERGNVNGNDPVGTFGHEMRRWCTRFLRESSIFNEMGWVACRHSQVEGIRNDGLGMKVAFMNTDARTGMLSKQPRSVSDKGPISERIIKHNEHFLQGSFEDFEPPQSDPILDYDFWYLCCHVSEQSITAELSRPVGLTGGIVDEYSHRIILWQPGDKAGIRLPDPVPEDFAEIEKPAVVRKL